MNAYEMNSEKTQFLLERYRTHSHLLSRHHEITCEYDDDEVELTCKQCNLGYSRHIEDGDIIPDKDFTIIALEVLFLQENGKIIGSERFWHQHLQNFTKPKTD
jgi:hypothetical protein